MRILRNIGLRFMKRVKGECDNAGEVEMECSLEDLMSYCLRDPCLRTLPSQTAWSVPGYRWISEHLFSLDSPGILICNLRQNTLL